MSNFLTTRFPWFFVCGLVVGGATAVGVMLAFTDLLPMLWARASQDPSSSRPRPAESLPELELVEGRPHTVAIPGPVRDALGIGDSYPVRVPEQGPPLVMPGSTALDPTRLARVRARFNAEIREIARVPGAMTLPARPRPSSASCRRAIWSGKVRSWPWSGAAKLAAERAI